MNFVFTLLTVVVLDHITKTNDLFCFHCSLKIFIPLTILAFVVLVPVNAIKGTVHDIDKLSMSNVESGSPRLVRLHKFPCGRKCLICLNKEVYRRRK